MIHYWQCKRCTHEWQSSCFSHIMEKAEDRERNSRQLWSHLCWDCFEQLEAGEIAGLELFNLLFYLKKKSEKYDDGRVLGKMQVNGLYEEIRYSGMCHPYRSTVYGADGNTIVEKGNFESGFTAEQQELYKIISEVEVAYMGIISQQRTAKRVELDEYQKTSGFVFFGSQPRPEGFVGDPPGKQRFEALFGIDFASGEFVSPTIQLSKSSIAEGGSPDEALE